MKKHIVFIILYLNLVQLPVFSQSVGIASERFQPDSSAILELRSDTKGLLIPRLTSDQRDRISLPSTGLLLYQTDVAPGFYYFNGAAWVPLLTIENLPVDDNQVLSFDPVNYLLMLENGGTADLSILRNGRSLETTKDNGDGTITFVYNDGTSFTTSDLRGPKGDSGPAGKDGHTILTGNSSPAPGLGTNGDIFIDTQAQQLYGPKTNNIWGAATSLKGEAGAAGNNGTDGKTIRTGNNPPEPSLGKNGDIYINMASHQLFGPKANGSWGDATSLIGPSGSDGKNGSNGTNGIDGTDGKTILNGNSVPSASTGKEGDFYLNTTLFDLFGPKTGGNWGTPVSLVGPKGEDGLDGTDGVNGTDGLDGKSLLHGATIPDTSLGNNGDFYINTNSSELFGPKTAGSWPSGVALIGADGKDGTNGIDGQNGMDGNTILNGTTDPDAGIGANGDIFLNTNTSSLFGPKANDAWGAGISLIGSPGFDGTDGTNGLNGQDGNTILNGTTDPDPSIGNNGDIFLNTNTSTLFGPKANDAWGVGISLIGSPGFDGTDGTNGLNGQDGNTILNATTDPDPSIGNNGDIFLNTNTSTLFGPKANDAWGAGISLIGSPGTDGTDGKDGLDGEDGRTILNGTTNPNVGIGKDGDFYLNTSTHTIFGPKSGGLWSSGESLIGTGIQSSSDNPDGSITFNFTDGTSFTSQPDGDFSSNNELISQLKLTGKTLQITENGVSKTIDLSPISSTTQITDTDENTTVTVDQNGNDDIIRFITAGTESMRLKGKTLEFVNNLGTVAIGENTALNNAGAGNVAIGTEASFQNTSGRFNVALGYRALRQNTTGEGNIAIGFNAGFNETGSNKLYIDNSNTNTPLIWGDFNLDVTNINGKLGIGVASPANMTNELEVNGSAVMISLTETSDQRFKKNVNTLGGSLAKVQQLRGISFDWKTTEFPQKRFKNTPQIGFIAQEVRQVFPQLVSQTSDGYYSVSYSGMTPVLVEAIKEQQQLIDELRQMVLALKAETESLKKTLDNIQQQKK